MFGKSDLVRRLYLARLLKITKMFGSFSFLFEPFVLVKKKNSLLTVSFFASEPSGFMFNTTLLFILLD